MCRRKALHIFTLFCILNSAALAAERTLPPASAEKLPKWRGFNLLEKFSKGWSNKPFVEEDFKLISSLGFNFVRLPMDYRTWIKDNDWTQFNEQVLKEIDQAVEWGRKYGIHVCINFHRAPGYTVASPPEKTSLWTDPETQRICAMHWATFAKRYKGIPNDNLSFNLLNEPSIEDGQVYFKVAQILVDAIRKEDPDRLIIADGLRWGSRPTFDLVPLKIAQSTRGYSPMEISHYKASWIHGSENMPVPRWPMSKANSYLYGPSKKDIASPFTIEGNFPEASRLRIKVQTVSSLSKLDIKADGKLIFEKNFSCGAGTGEWEKVVFKPEWKIYQNIFNKNYSVTLPCSAKQITLENTAGDWMTISEIGIVLPSDQSSDNEHVLMPSGSQWGQKHEIVRFEPSDKACPFKTSEMMDQHWLWKNNIEPWLKFEATKTGIIVGEWGAFNKTSHEVTLRWMQDCLENWEKTGWGWALWNFRGSFGILDSERKDVTYEEFNGHKLDRKMLDLLKKH
jgi:aryl-phospho-beta-D-glucosidase BglC (GH1 family)